MVDRPGSAESQWPSPLENTYVCFKKGARENRVRDYICALDQQAHWKKMRDQSPATPRGDIMTTILCSTPTQQEMPALEGRPLLIFFLVCPLALDDIHHRLDETKHQIGNWSLPGQTSLVAACSFFNTFMLLHSWLLVFRILGALPLVQEQG